MKNRTLFSLFTSLLVCGLFLPAVQAQTQGIVNNKLQKLRNWAREPRVLANLPNTDIKGSPYYIDEWKTGYVQVSKDAQSNAVKLKYSSYNNELLFKENGRVMALPSNALIGFTIIDDNREIVFKNGFQSNEHDINQDQLMRVIYGGDVKLLAKEYTNLHKSEDPFKGEMVYDFLDETNFYLISANGAYHKIDLNKDDILDALGNHKEKLEAFAESHNLDFENEYHASLILKHYDKISSSNQNLD